MIQGGCFHRVTLPTQRAVQTWRHSAPEWRGGRSRITVVAHVVVVDVQVAGSVNVVVVAGPSTSPEPGLLLHPTHCRSHRQCVSMSVRPWSGQQLGSCSNRGAHLQLQPAAHRHSQVLLELLGDSGRYQSHLFSSPCLELGQSMTWPLLRLDMLEFSWHCSAIRRPFSRG